MFIASKSRIQDIFVYIYLRFFSAWVLPSGKMKRISDHTLLWKAFLLLGLSRTVLSLQRQLFYYRNCFLQEFSLVSHCICSSIWNALRNYLHSQWKTNLKCKELSRRSILIIKELTQLLLHIAVMIRAKVRSSLNAVNAAETNWLLTKCRNVPHTFFS